ncbi:hypothetical protein, partial [Modestobacter lacusdianchii]
MPPEDAPGPSTVGLSWDRAPEDAGAALLGDVWTEDRDESPAGAVAARGARLARGSGGITGGTARQVEDVPATLAARVPLA